MPCKPKNAIFIFSGGWQRQIFRWKSIVTWQKTYPGSFAWGRAAAVVRRSREKSRGKNWHVSCSSWLLWNGCCWARIQPQASLSSRRTISRHRCADTCSRLESPPIPAGKINTRCTSYAFEAAKHTPAAGTNVQALLTCRSWRLLSFNFTLMWQFCWQIEGIQCVCLDVLLCRIEMMIFR